MDLPEPTANGKSWTCAVVGWDYVILTELPGSPAKLRLKLQNKDPHQCLPERFAEKVEKLGGMVGNIVSIRDAALESGEFEGTCATMTTDWVRGGCEVTIAVPADDPPAAPLRGTSCIEAIRRNRRTAASHSPTAD